MQMELQRWEIAFASHKVRYRWEAAACRQRRVHASAPRCQHPNARCWLMRAFGVGDGKRGTHPSSFGSDSGSGSARRWSKALCCVTRHLARCSRYGVTQRTPHRPGEACKPAQQGFTALPPGILQKSPMVQEEREDLPGHVLPLGQCPCVQQQCSLHV